MNLMNEIINRQDAKSTKHYKSNRIGRINRISIGECALGIEIQWVLY